MRKHGRYRCLAFGLLALAARVAADDGGAGRDAKKSIQTLDEVVVEGDKPRSAASAQEIRAKDYELRPHGTPFEILNNVPGLVVTQHQGGAKAAQYLLRGFDSDHGTDIALFVDGVPVNLVTHGHGQGYADFSFVIPEVIDRFELHKGPYFAELGDFATSGALSFVTKDEVPESFVRTEGGSFEKMRSVVLASPEIGPGKSLLAVQANYSDGPFDNEENLAQYNLFAKYTIEPMPDARLAISLTGYAADWDASGQLPQREIFAGRLDRFGVIDPTEGGQTDRQILNLDLSHRPTPADDWRVRVHATRYRLRLHSNFTFFRDTGLRFVRDPDGTIRDTGDGSVEPGAEYLPGDGIQQDDERFMVGLTASYARQWELAGIPAETRVGLQNRNDVIDVALARQIHRREFFKVNDVRVVENSISGFLANQFFLTEWARLEIGLRGDVFLFDVDDRLPVQGADPDFEAVPVDGSESDSIVSPKANLILGPWRESYLYLNFGTGFHSNDARSVIRSKSDASDSPLVQALGYEIGARSRVLDRIDVAAALWLLDLESELTFSGDGGDVDADLVDGNFAPGPATRRWGVDFELRAEVTEWLFFDYDLAYANAHFRAGGGVIPVAPDLLMNGGMRVEPFPGLSAALRLRMLDNRPADEADTITARGYTVLDFVAQYRWRNVELSLLVFNLTNADINEAQFADTSCVRGEIGLVPGCVAKPSLVDAGEGAPDIHLTPGNPVGARGGLTVYF